jgi:ubiquinone/menaquinone biosynthesis C-methylase UbiE
MANEHAGSYDFGGFEENQGELERLKRQAAIAAELERSILQRVGLREGMTVMDLACGPGIVTGLLARMAAPGMVTGIDLNETLLDEAQAFAAAEGVENVRFRQGDVYALDEPHGHYDFIYARFLFQHLAEPQKALEQVLPLLKPGGKLCVLDIDDDWLSIYPEPEGFRSFTRRAAEGQNAYGGDRRVGRKLGHLLQNSGFTHVDETVITVTSRQIGMRNFLDITTGFKREQVPKEQAAEARRELENIYSLAEAGDAWGFVGVFVATGIRP